MLDLKIMAPELTWRAFFRDHMASELTAFFGGHLSNLIWSIFRARLGESGKIPTPPKKFAYSYTYAKNNSYILKIMIIFTALPMAARRMFESRMQFWKPELRITALLYNFVSGTKSLVATNATIIAAVTKLCDLPGWVDGISHLVKTSLMSYR